MRRITSRTPDCLRAPLEIVRWPRRTSRVRNLRPRSRARRRRAHGSRDAHAHDARAAARHQNARRARSSRACGAVRRAPRSPLLRTKRVVHRARRARAKACRMHRSTRPPIESMRGGARRSARGFAFGDARCDETKRAPFRKRCRTCSSTVVALVIVHCMGCPQIVSQSSASSVNPHAFSSETVTEYSVWLHEPPSSSPS